MRGWQADISQKLSEARSRASNGREELNKANRRGELTELRSDFDAVVQSLEKVSVGACFSPESISSPLFPQARSLRSKRISPAGIAATFTSAIQ